MRKNPEQARISELEEELEGIREQISSVLGDEDDREDDSSPRGQRRR